MYLNRSKSRSLLKQMFMLHKKTFYALLIPIASFVTARKGDLFFKSQKNATNGCWWRAKAFYDHYQDGLIDLEWRSHSTRSSSIHGGGNNFQNIEMLRKYLRTRAKQTDGVRFDGYKAVDRALEGRATAARNAEAKGPLQLSKDTPTGTLSLVQRNRMAFEQLAAQTAAAAVASTPSRLSGAGRGKGNIDAALDAPSLEAKYEVSSFGGWSWHPWYTLCQEAVSKRRSGLEGALARTMHTLGEEGFTSLDIMAMAADNGDESTSSSQEPSTTCIDTRPRDIKRLEVLALMVKSGIDVTVELATFEETERQHHLATRKPRDGPHGSRVIQGEDAYTLVSAQIKPFNQGACLAKTYKLPIEFYLVALQNAFDRGGPAVPVDLIKAAVAAFPDSWAIPDLIARLVTIPAPKARRLRKILAALGDKDALVGVFGQDTLQTKVADLAQGLGLLRGWRDAQVKAAIPNARLIEGGDALMAGSFATRKVVNDLNLTYLAFRNLYISHAMYAANLNSLSPALIKAKTQIERMLNALLERK